MFFLDVGNEEEVENFTYDTLISKLYKDDSKGYISVFRKGFKNVFNRCYKKNDLSMGLKYFFDNDFNNELYCTLNTFYKPQRTLENLRYLNALYIDIDCYKLNIRKESVIYFLEEDFYDKSIPIPTFVVDSGRGLYLIWLIEPVPSKALKLWSAMQHYLYDQLKEFGADRMALDAARVLRVVGSYNTKSNSDVKVIDFNNTCYTLKELKYEYLPEVKEVKEVKHKLKKTYKGKIVRAYNEFSLNKARLEDIYKLIKLRECDIDGQREVLLFLYRYYASLVNNEEEALEMTLELNSKLKEPLNLSEVTGSTHSNYLGKYNYRNETLVELLDITEDEMEYMTTIVSKGFKRDRNNEKRKASRRNEEGLTSRELEKRNTMLSILKAMNEDKGTKVISEELGISARTIQRYKKEFKEDNELLNKLQKILREEELEKEHEDRIKTGTY